jgi:hypothetical protein
MKGGHLFAEHAQLKGNPPLFNNIEMEIGISYK